MQTQRNFTLPQSAAGRHVYRIVSSTLSGNIQVFQDGVSCGTTAGNNFFAIGRIADLNNQAARHFGLYYLTVRDSANTLINHYDPSASDGIGSTLIDTVGGNNGTLVNFPSNNSQWVFYDDGGGAFELTPETGGFSYAGGELSLTVSRELSVAGAAYSCTGGNVDLRLNRSLALESGLYGYTGQDIELTAGRVINPQAGVYSYTGGAVDLQYNQDTDITLNIESGAFSFAGGDVSLTVNRHLGVTGGELSYSGSDIDFSAGKFLALESGVFSYSSGDLPLSVSRALSIDSGAFSYAGGSIIITYSGQAIRRITNYSVNYEQDDLVIAYAADDIAMAYENDFIAMQYEDITSGGI